MSALFRKAAVLALALQLVGCNTREERAQNFLTSGQEHLAKGDLTKADVEFRNAVRHKKDLLPAWRGLAQIEERRQNWAGLIPVLQNVVELDLNDGDARLKLARLMIAGGGFDQALSVVAPLSDTENPPGAAVALKATALLGMKDRAGAVAQAQRALSLEPGNAEALIVLATEMISRGDFAGALAAIEKSKPRPDQDTAFSIIKAQIFDRTRDDARLEAELRKLVAANPIFRRQLVQFYLSRGRNLDAESELRAAAAKDPNNAEPIMELVRFLQSKKGPQAAKEELQARISAGGDVFGYQLTLAELTFAGGETDRGIEEAKKLVATTVDRARKIKAQTSLATMLLAQKNFADAESLLAGVLETDRRQIDALRLRAALRIQQGRLDDAIADLREALGDQPQSAPLLELLAGALERTGAIELAEKHYADAARFSNFDPRFGLPYVRFLQRRGNGTHAEEVLTQIVSRNPTNVEVWTALGDAKLRKRDWLGAQEVADTIKRLGAPSGIAEQLRGVALSGQNKLNESIQALQAAYAGNPSSGRPLANLVAAYLRAQKPAEAETLLKSILGADPNNADALVLMASVQAAKKQSAPALRSLNEAIKRQPDNPAGYVALAEFYLGKNDLDRALETARAGLNMSPNHFNLQSYVAEAFLRKHDYEGAISAYELLLAKHPDSLVAANNLASLLSEHRSDPASLERAQTLAAMLQRSNIPQFKDTVAWLSYQRGDYRTAVALLEEVVQAVPTLASVRYHLGMSYLKIGQTEKGQEQLRKAAELAAKDPILTKRIAAALKET